LSHEQFFAFSYRIAAIVAPVLHEESAKHPAKSASSCRNLTSNLFPAKLIACGNSAIRVKGLLLLMSLFPAHGAEPLALKAVED
jgi:hypothetical protein